MPGHRIIIYIEGLNLPQFKWMLNDFFVWKKSPLYPTYVYCDLHHEYIGDEKEAIRTKGLVDVKVTFTNFQVVEAAKDENTFPIPLARMHFQTYISQFVVFVDGIEGEEKNWYKVETILQAIISQAELLNFNIEKTEPDALGKSSKKKLGVGKQNLKKRPPVKPKKIPPKPCPPEDYDEWFDYYHECKEAEVKITLDDLVKDLHRSSGHIREMHRLYKIRHSIDLTT